MTSTRIGDAVLSAGLLDYLSKTYPDVRITVASGHLPAPLFRSFPGVERVIPVTKRPLALHWVSLWCATVGNIWDIVIDLRGSALGWLLAAKSRRIIGAAGGGEHRVETLGRLFGLSPPPPPVLHIDPAAKTRAEGLLGGGPVIGLGVAANWLPKIWPAERFVALADRIRGENKAFAGARFAVFGGPGEEMIARPVLEGLGANGLDLVGKTTIVETAACLDKCAVFVGNDSGLMHMAAALGVPTIGLFGPSPPAHYGPWGNHCRAVTGDIAYEEIVGDPEFDHRHTDNLMRGLPVERVYQAVCDLPLKHQKGEEAQ